MLRHLRCSGLVPSVRLAQPLGCWNKSRSFSSPAPSSSASAPQARLPTRKMADGRAVSVFGYGDVRPTNHSQFIQQDITKLLAMGGNVIELPRDHEAAALAALTEAVAHGQLDRDETLSFVTVSMLEAEQERQQARSRKLKIAQQPDNPSQSFLNREVSRAMERTGEDFIDLVMIRGVDASAKEENFDAKLTLAFTQLEEQVKQGRIGSYGICSSSLGVRPPSSSSSSTASSPLMELPGLDLVKIMQVANKVSKQHHFSTVMVACNALETSALTAKTCDGKTPVQFAKSEGLLVLGDRPFDGAPHVGPIVRMQDFQRVDGQEASDRLRKALNTALQVEGALTNIYQRLSAEEKEKAPNLDDVKFAEIIRDSFFDLYSVPIFEYARYEQLWPGVMQQLKIANSVPSLREWCRYYHESMVELLSAYEKGVQLNAAFRSSRINEFFNNKSPVLRALPSLDMKALLLSLSLGVDCMVSDQFAVLQQLMKHAQAKNPHMADPLSALLLPQDEALDLSRRCLTYVNQMDDILE